MSFILITYKIYTFFVTKQMQMERVYQKITSKIRSFERGKIFFTDEFLGMNTISQT